MGRGRGPWVVAGWALSSALAGAAPPEQGTAAYQVDGDGIPRPLTLSAGDAARGRAIVANRQLGLCLLCHAGPVPEERFQGNLAPDLAGSGSRWNAAQLRLRIVDAGRINPDTIMPAYYRTDGLSNVAPALAGKTMLNAQQVEDVVAYLLTLKEREGD